jgi:hypothetical protein
MKNTKRFALASILMAAVALLLSVMLVFSSQAPAYSANPFSEVIRRVQLLINPPPEKAPAGRSRGGAGRGPQCVAVERSVTALVPTRTETWEQKQGDQVFSLDVEYVWGATVEEHPILWLYIPYSAPDNLKQAEFMLLDENEQPVLAEPVLVELSGTPGIISFRIPYSLTINQSYNWYFSLMCDPRKPSRNPGVRGWLQRVEPDPALLTDLEVSDPRERYMAYAQHGIWFETATTLANNRKTYPEDEAIQGDWEELLTFLDVPDLIQTPIVDCCTSEPVAH